MWVCYNYLSSSLEAEHTVQQVATTNIVDHALWRSKEVETRRRGKGEGETSRYKVDLRTVDRSVD